MIDLVVVSLSVQDDINSKKQLCFWYKIDHNRGYYCDLKRMKGKV
jgi:hypothetical protein